MTPTKRAVTRTAHAKINLTLHVTGQRDDGYHLLDSLVMFTALGDHVTVQDADQLTLKIAGPFAEGLSCDGENLVMQAARLMAPDRGAAIHLDKRLPLASGIGGGSADAAATLLALSELWNAPLPDWADILTLGADVPLCLSTEISHMRGIGEQIQLIGPAPNLDVLLVNPRVEMPTPAVFAALANKANPPMPDPMSGAMPNPFDTEAWIDWISTQRNDLQTPALQTVPQIGDVLTALQTQAGCRLARMSGSGATCFALFEDTEARDTAAAIVQRTHPDWWVAPTEQALT